MDVLVTLRRVDDTSMSEVDVIAAAKLPVVGFLFSTSYDTMGVQ